MRESQNPCNFTFEDCQLVLERLGFIMAPNAGTSHRKFVLKRDGAASIIVGILKPGAGAVKKWYVSDMLDTLERNGLLPDPLHDDARDEADH